MPLKLLKIQINLEVKANSSDSDDIRERVYEEIQELLETEDLEFIVEEDEEDIDDES